jgi:putative DNA modification/repair radical SAM protein
LHLAEKLAILSDAAKYDASCASSGSNVRRAGKGVGSTEGMGICHSYTPDGRCVSLLKILLTNYCIFDCKYCINRISSNVRRARFSVAEVVSLTLEFYKRNYIEGLFLSSGIIRDSDYTMEQLVEIARTLRVEHGFKGYIHLKTIPGAQDELVQKAGLFADRLSVNIELPTDEDLRELAPEKNRPQLERNMATVENKLAEFRGEKKAPIYAPAGQSTQMIVGATPSPDREVLRTADLLYRSYRLRRVYYSAFSPIQDAHPGLAVRARPPLLREHRLYQADWMLRFYGFRVDEIVPLARPELALDMDPKSAWALQNREFFPVNINKAGKEALLRVPGFGTRTVQKILRLRRVQAVRLDDLKKMRCALERAKAFVVTADHTPGRLLERADLARYLAPAGEQLELAL